VGDTGVDESSIARRQSQGTFGFKMRPTVSASHFRATMTIGSERVDLMLWDTAGQAQFASPVPMYARGAHVCIIVASIVNLDSCDNITLWQDRLPESGENPPIVIARNETERALALTLLKKSFLLFRHFVSSPHASEIALNNCLLISLKRR
jgi:GTPase SAR1 family protein